MFTLLVHKEHLCVHYCASVTTLAINSMNSADLSGVNYTLNHQKCCLQLTSVQLTFMHYQQLLNRLHINHKHCCLLSQITKPHYYTAERSNKILLLLLFNWPVYTAIISGYGGTHRSSEKL